MNIFYLDKRTYNCAKDHCDKHVVKMILEYAQLLSTAHRIMDGDEGKDGMYKATHKNHPSAVWVRRNRCHYRYVYNLLRYLCGEYTIRYGKTHKTAQLLPLLLNCPKALETELWDFWEPPQCMPDDYMPSDKVAIPAES